MEVLSLRVFGQKEKAELIKHNSKTSLHVFENRNGFSALGLYGEIMCMPGLVIRS